MPTATINEASKLTAILDEINGDNELMKRFVYATNGGNIKDVVSKIVDQYPYVNTPAEVYDTLICMQKSRLPKALRHRLESRFGAIEFERDWANDAELHRVLASKGVCHADAYAPACYILNKAFPGIAREVVIAEVANSNISIKKGILSAEEIALVADIAPKSDELRKELVALIEAFLPSNGKTLTGKGSVTSRYNFSFSDVMDIMSKLNVANAAEAEEKLAEIEAEHAQEITCAADFIKFIS